MDLGVGFLFGQVFCLKKKQPTKTTQQTHNTIVHLLLQFNTLRIVDVNTP